MGSRVLLGSKAESIATQTMDDNGAVYGIKKSTYRVTVVFEFI